MELKNKSIIITGASSGIGAAAAALFAAEGANVVLGARRTAHLCAVTGAIEGTGKAVYLAGDVRDEGYADALVNLAIGAHHDIGQLERCHRRQSDRCIPCCQGANTGHDTNRRWRHRLYLFFCGF